MLAAFLLAATAPDAASVFDDCIRAHNALKAASVTLEVTQVLKGQTTKQSYEFKFILPRQLWLRIKEPEQGGRGASDRTFFIDGPQIYGYDAKVHEKLTRKTIPVGGLIQKFSLTVGQVDDAVASLLEPGRLKDFLSPFRNAGGWRRSPSSGVLTLSRSSGSNVTKFSFDAADKRLRGLDIAIPDGRLTWSLRYVAKPGKLSWRPPADARSVESFTLLPTAPRYASASAKKIAERSMAAYDRLRHVHFRIEGAGGGVKAWISGNRFREEGDGIAYVWDRRTASIRVSRTKTFYTGKAGSEGMLNALARLGGRMDPMVRQLALRNNPIRVMLVPGVQVRHMGSITLQGAPGDILEFRNMAARVSFVVRQDNGLLTYVRTETLSPEGEVVAEAQKTYVYGSVGKALDPALFKLLAPKGFKKAPISAITKK